MLPRPLDELIRIARRDDWDKFLLGSDLRQILGEVERLQEREHADLLKSVASWKDRLGRLDMMAAEMADTPGAERLTALAAHAAHAIDKLDRELNETLQTLRVSLHPDR